MPDTGILLFPMGLTGIILGSAAWIAGAGGDGDPRRNPLARAGFFTIFGLTFFAVGAILLVADQSPDIDHTTNVLTTIGFVFGLIGIGSIGTEIVLRTFGAANARILAAGLRGRATVLAVRDTNMTLNNNPLVALDLRVEIPGQPVFTRTVRETVSRLDVGSFRSGLVLAVAADPANPQKIVIDWDQAPIGDVNAARDPVTGQPLAASPGSGVFTGQGPLVAATNQLSSEALAGILRYAAGQVTAGSAAAQSSVVSAVTSSGSWSVPAGSIPGGDVETILRSIADRANQAGAGTPMTADEIATILRQASDAAARGGSATGWSSDPGSDATGSGSS